MPANPFSEISDGAIEYFVEWSMEQSTAPKPKAAEAHFANVDMLTPRAEKRRSMRGPLLSGIAIGIFLGLPLGGAIVWFLRPLPPPIIVEKMPEIGPPRTVAPVEAPPAVVVADLAVVAKVEPPADLSVPEKLVQPVAKHKKGELAIKTNPSGATVSIDGEAQDGKTPLTVTLSAGRTRCRSCASATRR